MTPGKGTDGGSTSTTMLAFACDPQHIAVSLFMFQSRPQMIAPSNQVIMLKDKSMVEQAWAYS